MSAPNALLKSAHVFADGPDDAPAFDDAAAGRGGFDSALGAGSAAVPVTLAASTPVAAGTMSGTAAAPSWIATLSDSVIRTDMTAAAAGGTVAQAGMGKLFTDLAAELTSGKTTLSASQYNDLKTVAADLNTGESASSYLTYITGALVNGNAANATWMGGKAQPVALGNLATGATATQLTELTGKWFLGTDLPSSTVQMSGTATFSVSYAADTNPVFAATGPGINDINQGYLGDCYLLASLGEVASRDPSLITSMFTDNGNGTYGVRFYLGGVARYVTVNTMLANGGTEFNRGTDIWASLAEKAYAQIQASGLLTGNSVNAGNSYSTIGNGGAPGYALAEITGVTTMTDFDASGTAWTRQVYAPYGATQSVTPGLTTASVISTLAADLAAGDALVLSSRTNAQDSKGMTTLVANHALSIYGYDSATGSLEIRNPWGSAQGQSWDTTFEVSLNTLLSDGDIISVAAPAATIGPAVQNVLVSAAAGLQANAQVTSFTIADTLANVTSGLPALTADTKLTGITLTGGTGTPALALTAAQFAADAHVVSLIGGALNLTVTGVTVAGATAAQGNAQVTSFTVADTASAVGAGLQALNADGKLKALTITGTSGADTINLSGSHLAATIDLGGDTASVAAGLSAPSLTFIGTPDMVTLGSGAATIDYVLQGTSGIEVIANFTYGLDQLDIALGGAATSSLHAANTICNGKAAIALYGAAGPTHGVVLTNLGTGMTAANLLASHMTFSGGNAIIG